MSDQKTPQLSDVQLTLLARAKFEIRVAMPAVVQAYDATKQTVDVQPLLQELQKNDDGTTQPVTLPVVPSVPVVFPGGGGFRVTFPIQQGDIVLLVCADRSIDRWSAGSGGQPVDPVALTRHMLADAFAIPGVHPLGAPLQSAPTVGATLGQDNGLQVTFMPNHIEVGGKSDAAALASSVLSQLQALITTFNSHTHDIAVTGVQVGSGTGVGSAATPSPSAAAATNPASTQLLVGG